jgi:segregation and condensation protein B
LTTEIDEKPESPAAAAAAPAAEDKPVEQMPLSPELAPPAKTDEQELHEATQTELQQLAEAARFATPERARAVVEALLFAAEKPLDLAMLRDTTQFSAELVQGAINELLVWYAPGSGGIVLVELGGGRWQLRTDPQVGAYVRRMLQVKPMRLTRAALETLAIVAYRQPITRPEIEDLRGVDCGAVTKALLERKLIRILGKKDEPGRPLLYGTSKEFLELFNLKDLTQLPTLREFQELSEESRKIVEEEVPNTPPIAGLSQLAQDPAVAERMAAATVESDAALDQLESAMASAEEQTKTAAAVLAPPAAAESAQPAPPAPGAPPASPPEPPKNG